MNYVLIKAGVDTYIQNLITVFKNHVSINVELSTFLVTVFFFFFFIII